MQSSSYKYDIIIVGLQPWDIPLGSNCVDIAKVLSSFCRVLYVNRATDFRTELQRLFRIRNIINFSSSKKKYNLTELIDLCRCTKKYRCSWCKPGCD